MSRLKQLKAFFIVRVSISDTDRFAYPIAQPWSKWDNLVIAERFLIMYDRSILCSFFSLQKKRNSGCIYFSSFIYYFYFLFNIKPFRFLRTICIVPYVSFAYDFHDSLCSYFTQYVCMCVCIDICIHIFNTSLTMRYIPFVKMFSPRKVIWRIKQIIFLSYAVFFRFLLQALLSSDAEAISRISRLLMYFGSK